MPKGQYDRTIARAKPPDQPAQGVVRLTADHGFVNEYDAVYFKRAGAVITNPVEIAILRKRGALLEDA